MQIYLPIAGLTVNIFVILAMGVALLLALREPPDLAQQHRGTILRLEWRARLDSNQ